MRYKKLFQVIFLFLVAFFGCSPSIVSAQVATIPNFKVAFIGDSGAGSNFETVLNLIKNEAAQLILHQGDYGYSATATTWGNQVNAVLGDQFPYLGSDGNHENWSDYVPFFTDRLTKMGISPASTGINTSNSNYTVDYKGLRMVFVKEPGNDPNHITQQLANDNHIWKICSWHQNMNDMQAGEKGNETGWPSYQACQDLGAIIATGHEHSYSRTKTLTGVHSNGNHTSLNPPNQVQVVRGNGTAGSGKGFVFVSGLGGQSRRDYSCSQHDDDTWWASIFTSNYFMKNGTQIAKDCNCSSDYCAGVNPQYNYGALFITFYVDGNPAKARGYFKTSGGYIADEFEIYATGNPLPSYTPRPSPTSPPPVTNLLHNWLTATFDLNSDGKINALDFGMLIP